MNSNSSIFSIHELPLAEIELINIQGSLIYYNIYAKDESRIKIKLEVILAKMLGNLSPIVGIIGDEISVNNTINNNLLVVSALGLQSIFKAFGSEASLLFICEDVIRTIKGEKTHLTLVEKL